MTIEKEEPGIWVATCDQCGDRHICDADHIDTREVAEAEILEGGWEADPEEKVRFPNGHSGRKSLKVSYETHRCPDCV